MLHTKCTVCKEPRARKGRGMDQSLRPVVDETRGIYRVPRRAFVDQSVFERECRAIFDKCWLYLGHASELPNPGARKSVVSGKRVSCRVDLGGPRILTTKPHQPHTTT